MRTEHYPAGVAIGRHPLYSIFMSFPGVCFVLTLLTDLAYWQSANLQWQNFSSWLLFAGLVVGGLVLLVRIVEIVFRRGTVAGPGWLHAFGTAVVLLLGLVNSFVHARDGWTAVVPEGLVLSGVAVAVMLVTGFVGTVETRNRASGVVHV